MKEIFVSSDVDKLDQIIVQTPGAETRHTQLIAPNLNLPGFTRDTIGQDAQKEHVEFINILRASGARVLSVSELLNESIEVAKSNGNFEALLKTAFPRLLGLNPKERGNLSAGDLTGTKDETFYPELPGTNPFRNFPLQWMYYTRDFAVGLPKGFAITRFTQTSRQPENALARFIFQYSARLRDYSIIFDAEKENVSMEGGDVVVLNERTIVMGVDNLSQRRAAERLAKVTNMDVVAVAMPTGPASPSWRETESTAFNYLFLHLDTILNLIDSKKALAVPYFLQNEFSAANPLLDSLDSLTLESLSEREKGYLQNFRKAVGNVGWVSIYQAGSGESLDTNQKLVNFLEREFGYSFVFIGGEPRTSRREQVKHLIETVIPEIRFQAGNVLALEPGRVVMYKNDTEETQKALRNLGIEVITFDGHELVRWNGGPHCMTMPLRRLG